MDEQTKTLLAEYLKKLLQAAESGASFAAEQIPLVVQEKLAFDFWSSVMWATVSAISMVLVWYGYYKLNVMAEWDEETTAPTTVAAAFCTLPLLVVIFVNLSAIIKIQVAPRLYIVEWLKGML
jgi:hypothetical protein